MAFNDNPQFDESARASEESVLAVKNWFTLRRGFRCREENPDNGTDLNIELGDPNRKDFTGSKFPVQIKSNQSIEIVYKDSIPFISYSIKTSRLGYFSRIPPSYGLFVIYDVKSGNIYYDFTEKIIARIDEQRDDDWKNQDKVKVNIPLTNVLSEETIITIYKTLIFRFENLARLIHEQGSNYSIPSNSFKSKNTEWDIFEKFEQIGYLLFNDREFDCMYRYFETTSRHKIINSKSQTLLAFITYCELGRAIEANFYLSKSKRFNNDFDDFEKDLRELYILKLEYILGSIDTDKYADGLENLQALTESDINRISICTNIMQLRLIGIFQEDKINELKLEEELFRLLDTVNKFEKIDDITKYHLKINIAETIFIYTVNLFLNIGKIVMIQRDLKRESNYRRQDALKVVPLLNLVNKILTEAYKFSINEKDENLRAESAYKLGWIFVSMQFNLIMLKQLESSSLRLSQYNDAHNYFAESIDIFKNKGRVIEYRKALLGLYDLKFIYNFFKNELIGSVSCIQILDLIRKIELENDLPPINSATEDMINETYEKTDAKLLKDYTESNINDFLELLMKAYNLPVSCKENLLSSIKARAFFDKYNTENRFVLLENQPNANMPYSQPVWFIIQDKITGISTVGNTDINYIMKQMRMIE